MKKVFLPRAPSFQKPKNELEKIAMSAKTPMERAEIARDYFLSGYGCAQAVLMTFSDVTGFDADLAARMASSFGGGMGRMREVCGAVSGMLMVVGYLYGYDTPGDDTVKKEHYALVQELAGKFREQMGSIVCRELLKNPPSDPNPTERTPEFYKTRPCARMVALAARILDEYIAQHPVS